MVIGDLGDHLSWLPALARWHYDQWGPLTGASSFDGYVALLTEAAASRTVPSVLIAMADGELLGSANLVASDLPPRPELTPWLAQLFVGANSTAPWPGRRSRARGTPQSSAVWLCTRLSLHIGHATGVLPPPRLARCGALGVSPAGENSHGL